MGSRAGALAGACALTLLVVVALVVWRAPALTPGWRSAVGVAALVAVVALSTASVVAGALALRPEAPREVSVTVPPGSGAPVTAVTDAVGPRRWALAALVLAVVGTAPVLAVLVLASTGDAAQAAAPPDRAPAGSSPAPAPPRGGPATSGAPGSAQPTGAPSSGAPSTGDQPTGAPSTGDQPPGGSPTTDPSSSEADPGGPGSRSAAPDASEPSPAPDASRGPDETAPDGGAQGCRAVVAPGDTLWSIARGRLAATGPEPTDDQVAARTARLYAANQRLVGPDPDLVRPGQRLDVCVTGGPG